MNYEEILKFAISIDLTKSGSNDRVVVKCYKDMIIEQIQEILKVEKRIAHFKGKITEHLAGLEKMDIKFKVEEPIKKEVPNELLQERPSQSTKMQEVAGEPRLPGRDRKV